MNMMSMGIWYEGLMRWVGEATGVMAMGKTYVKMRKNEQGVLKPVRIPEHIDVVADLAGGAQLHLQISSVAGLTGTPEVYLFGSEGTLPFTENKLFGGKKADKALSEISIPAAQAGGWRVEEEFIAAIRGQEKIFHTTFENGVKYMEFTEAVTCRYARGVRDLAAAVRLFEQPTIDSKTVLSAPSDKTLEHKGVPKILTGFLIIKIHEVGPLTCPLCTRAVGLTKFISQG
jgi:hypothetical protein